MVGVFFVLLFLKNEVSEESYFDFHCWISSSLVSVTAE